MPRKHKMIEESNRVPNTFVPRFWEKHADSRSLVTRTVLARRRELRESIQADSPQQMSIIDRISFIELVLETMEVEAQETGQFDGNRYSSMTNTLVGLLRLIGLERKAKPVGNLSDHLREREADR